MKDEVPDHDAEWGLFPASAFGVSMVAMARDMSKQRIAAVLHLLDPWYVNTELGADSMPPVELERNALRGVSLARTLEERQSVFDALLRRGAIREAAKLVAIRANDDRQAAVLTRSLVVSVMHEVARQSQLDALRDCATDFGRLRDAFEDAERERCRVALSQVQASCEIAVLEDGDFYAERTDLELHPLAEALEGAQRVFDSWKLPALSFGIDLYLHGMARRFGVRRIDRSVAGAVRASLEGLPSMRRRTLPPAPPSAFRASAPPPRAAAIHQLVEELGAVGVELDLPLAGRTLGLDLLSEWPESDY